MEKILIVEDDNKLRNFFKMFFERHKDTFEVIFAVDGEDAIEVLNQKYISLVVGPNREVRPQNQPRWEVSRNRQSHR